MYRVISLIIQACFVALGVYVCAHVRKAGQRQCAWSLTDVSAGLISGEIKSGREVIIITIPRSFFQLHPAILNRHAINHKLNPLHIDLQLEGWMMTALAPISCVSPSINPAVL